MASFIDIFRKKSSGPVAKDRLLHVLISDRVNCSPEVLDMIKNDIVKIISKYMEIDTEGLDIQITQSGAGGDSIGLSSISAKIPITDMRHRSGNGEK